MNVGDKVIIEVGDRKGEECEIVDLDKGQLWLLCLDGNRRWYGWHEISYVTNTSKPVEDKINHPSHYTKGIECYDYIKSWDMSFPQGNVVKYVTRYKDKNGVEDLKKARWYLDKLIEEAEKNV